MSWKHAKFDDSSVFRSLEKIAQEKGMIKNSEIVKKAEASIDLKPSENLTNNVIKLCSGLRAQGMTKYADELESKFVNYKKAQTLYETTKEKGEDLVDAAHPKGSHKLEGVDGDATVETILDQHSKIVDIINKKPTGKLASSKDIINAVKKAFGQSYGDVFVAGKSNMLKALDAAAAALALVRENNISGLGEGYSTMRRNAKGFLDVKKEFEEYSATEPMSAELSNAWDIAKRSLDSCINEWNMTEQRSNIVYKEMTVGGRTVKVPTGEHKREDKDRPWWVTFDSIKNAFLSARNLMVKAKDQLEGKEVAEATTVAQIPAKSVLSKLRYAWGQINKVNTDLSNHSVEEVDGLPGNEGQKFTKFKSHMVQELATLTSVISKFEKSTSDINPADISASFAGTTLAKDFAGITDEATLLARVNALVAGYVNKGKAKQALFTAPAQPGA